MLNISELTGKCHFCSICLENYDRNQKYLKRYFLNIYIYIYIHILKYTNANLKICQYLHLHLKTSYVYKLNPEPSYL